MIKGLVVAFALIFGASSHAADSVALGGPPSVMANIGVEGQPCSGVGTQAITSVGLPLSCQSGVWKSSEKIELVGPFVAVGNRSGVRQTFMGQYKGCFLTGQQSGAGNAACEIDGDSSSGFTLKETVLSSGTDHWCRAMCIK